MSLRIYRTWPMATSWKKDQEWLSDVYGHAVSEEMEHSPYAGSRKIDFSRKHEVSQMLEKLLFEEHHACCYIAEDDHHKVGYFLGMIKDCLAEIPDRIGYINGLYVIPEKRRLKVGQELLESGRRWFLQEGISFVELYIAHLNHEAKSFWKKNGYHVVEEVMATNYKSS